MRILGSFGIFDLGEANPPSLKYSISRVPCCKEAQTSSISQCKEGRRETCLCGP